MVDLNLYIVTFNCARNLVDPNIFASHLFDALPEPDGAGNSFLPDIIVLSLQEIAPLCYSFLGGGFLTPYLENFRYAVQIATSSRLGTGNESVYAPIIVKNTGMTALMVFATRNWTEAVRRVEVAGVGVGLWSMANKGAVGVRLSVSDIVGLEREDWQCDAVEMTFVAAHLAPFERLVKRRNDDWETMVRRLVFVPTSESLLQSSVVPRIQPATDSIGESEPLLAGGVDDDKRMAQGIYGPTSHLFIAGDLNYRSKLFRPGPNDWKTFPQPTEDRNDPRHFSHLLRDDQLTRELREGRTCHGLKEALIDFPPTYKYSQVSGELHSMDDKHGVWNWAKWRWPSWCDRILSLEPPPWAGPNGQKMHLGKYTALPIVPSSDHRPVALFVALPLEPVPDPANAVVEDSADPRVKPPFPIDPAWREKRASARRKEIAVGLVAYLAWTWVGNGVLLAMVVGSVGAWWMIRALIN